MKSFLRVPSWLVVLLILAFPPSRTFAGQGWDVEVHGGALISTNPTQGTIAMPPPNPPVAFLPQSPSPTTVPVASWFFGDGAALLNSAVPARFGVGIVSLAPLFTSRFAERRSGGSLGVRVGRSLSPRFGAEVSLDYATGQWAMLPHNTDRINVSEASFVATWNALLGAVINNEHIVNSDATLDDKRGSQLVTSGTLLINVLSSGGLQPYRCGRRRLYCGAQWRAVSDDHRKLSSAFPVSPSSPSVLQVDQTDTVTIRSTAKNSMTWVVGGGLKYALSERWGVRVDVRDYINRDVSRTTVTAVPAGYRRAHSAR